MKTPRKGKKGSPQARSSELPKYRVVLHNDQEHTFDEVEAALMEVLGLDVNAATDLAIETHLFGKRTVKVTHLEFAELISERLQAEGLAVTVEPEEEGGKEQ
jgi:ATP-dependent Clp protease adapter protein ClpS